MRPPDEAQTPTPPPWLVRSATAPRGRGISCTAAPRDITGIPLARGNLNIMDPLQPYPLDTHSQHRPTFRQTALENSSWWHQTRAVALLERGRCSEQVLVVVRGNGEEVGVKKDFVISHLFSCKSSRRSSGRSSGRALLCGR